MGLAPGIPEFPTEFQATLGKAMGSLQLMSSDTGNGVASVGLGQLLAFGMPGRFLKVSEVNEQEVRLTVGPKPDVRQTAVQVSQKKASAVLGLAALTGNLAR